jgi:aryl-alcohol dehydrogenase-like predicted oxidoreductase
MTGLSPSAQAVLDAFLKTPGEVPMPGWNYGRDLAAALRAASTRLTSAKAIDTLRAIADELEGSNG